jgi:hypothetical protein
VKKKIENYSDSRFISLTSLTRHEFHNLLEYFETAWQRYYVRYDLRGNPRKRKGYKEHASSSLKGVYLKLFFILNLLKSNQTQEQIGAFFEIAQSKVSEWFKCLLPILLNALRRMKVTPARNSSGLKALLEEYQDEILLLDGTERKILRPQDPDVQKDFYSKKKRHHAIKNDLICTLKGHIVYVSDTFEASVHDKKIFDHEPIECPENKEISILADLGFLGLNIPGATVFVPFRPSKLKPLTNFQKEVNSLISSMRVYVENQIASVKRLRMLKEKLRVWCYRTRHQIMEAGCALHNLRLSFRSP